MSLIPIINKPLSTQRLALNVGGYNFGYPWERVGFVGNRIAEIDEQVTLIVREPVCANRDRRCGLTGRVAQQFVRYETPVSKRPQQVV